MWTFDINYVTQNNSYMQLLATLCMKKADVHDFCGAKMSSIAIAVPKLDWVVQGVISSCLFSHATGLVNNK